MGTAVARPVRRGCPPGVPALDQGLRPAAHPDQQRSLATGEFPEAVEADGTRVEVTPAESPWRNGRTERAGGDWKATYHRVAEDTPEITTEAVFQEICDAVNYARGMLIREYGYSTYQRVLGKPPAVGEDPINEEDDGDLGVASKVEAGDEDMRLSVELRQRAMAAARECDCSRRWKRALRRAKRHYEGEYHTGQPIWYWRHGPSAKKRPISE